MGVIVQFNLAQWRARYPEFAAVPDDTVDLYFTEATLYQANNGTGPICDSNQALLLLNMATAHIAMLYSGTAAQPATGAVGRVASATEGSVSATLQNDYPPGSPQWWQQTKYGASWWAATAAFRTMRYYQGPIRVFNPPRYYRF